MELIKIEEKAAAFIKGQGGAVFLEAPEKLGMCCSKLNRTPPVRMGTPKFPEDYNVVDIDEVKVYLPEILSKQISHEITIVLNRFLWSRWLSIQGWRIV